MKRDQRWANDATFLHEGVSRLRFLSWAGLVISLWLLVAPFVLGYPRAFPGVRAIAVDVAVAVLAFCLAGYHALNWRTGRAGSRGVLYLGLFLIVGPTILGYFHTSPLHAAAWNDMICGVLLVATSLLSLAGSDAPS